MQDEVSPKQRKFWEAEELLDKGQNQKALKMLLELLEEYPEDDNALIINKVGVAYAQMGEMEKAEKYFYDAILINYQCVPALSNLGNVFLDRDDPHRAIALYKKALKYDADYAVAHNNLAAAYKRIRDIPKQVSHYKRSQQLKTAGETRAEKTDRRRRVLKQEEEELPNTRGCWITVLVVVAIIIAAFLILR